MQKYGNVFYQVLCTCQLQPSSAIEFFVCMVGFRLKCTHISRFLKLFDLNRFLSKVYSAICCGLIPLLSILAGRTQKGVAVIFLALM